MNIILKQLIIVITIDYYKNLIIYYDNFIFKKININDIVRKYENISDRYVVILLILINNKLEYFNIKSKATKNCHDTSQSDLHPSNQNKSVKSNNTLINTQSNIVKNIDQKFNNHEFFDNSEFINNHNNSKFTKSSIYNNKDVKNNLQNESYKFFHKLYKKCVVKCHPDKVKNKFKNSLFLLLNDKFYSYDKYTILLICKYLKVPINLTNKNKNLLDIYINVLNQEINALNTL